MKRQIRRNVFESNSSSSHSFQLETMHPIMNNLDDMFAVVKEENK